MKHKTDFYWLAGCVAFGWMVSSDLHAQRAAEAIAAVDASGVVTNITVSNGGSGYLAAPAVVIGGGGGSNAAARAVVANGSVAAIQILSGGAGYTNAPSVGIDPPDALVTLLGLGRWAALTLTGEIGSTQEVQAVEALGGGQAWTPVKSAVLTNGLWSFQDTNATASGQRFYRAVARGGARPATPEGMVWLPPGSFTMGSPLADPDYIANEGPQTEVRLTQGFFLGRREVSQGDYLSLMGTNPATFKGESNRPVETVSWSEAANYCAKLTQREQAAGRIPATWRCRLPTEAEWEYAARAGGTNRFGVNEALAGEYAWQGENSLETTHPAGGQRPNGWGLYDLAGNVAEWCADAYGDYPGGAVVDPLGATQGQARVVRGGSYLAPLAFCRAGARDARSGADYRDAWVGFRVALACGRAEAVVNPAAVGGTVSGLVTIKDSKDPVAGVAVYLVDTNYPADTNNLRNNRAALVAATVTGPDGRYCFSNVKPGSYAVMPMKTEDGSAWQLAAAGASASPFLTVSNGQGSVDFTAQYPSLFELENYQFIVNIYFDTTFFSTNGYSFNVSRKVWTGFGFPWSVQYGKPYGDEYLLFNTNLVHNMARIQLTACYGYSYFFGGKDNVFVVELSSGTNLLKTTVEYGLGNCPKESSWAWDIKGGRGKWPSGLGVPVAEPATKWEAPGRFLARWQPVAAAYGYVVEVSTDGTFAENQGRPTFAIDAGPATQLAVDLAVAPSVERPWFYRVVAYGDTVFSGYSGKVRVALDPLAAPSAQAASSVTPAGFTANWTPLAGAWGYRLDVAADPQFEHFILRDAEVGAGNSFSLASQLAAEPANYYRVRGVAGSLVSANSAVIRVPYGVAGMAWLAPGALVMGSPGQEPERNPNEGPQTQVTLAHGFWMSQRETTQAEYVSLMGTDANPSFFSGDGTRPVERVTWHEATNYCGKLTAQERAAGRLPPGYVYRLPTEAEWEYACRAGTATATAFGDSLGSSQANFDGRQPYGAAEKNQFLGQTVTVGQYQPNAWGLQDLHGNVLEWCLDWHGSYPGASVADPRGPDAGEGRVVRGGGYASPGRDCRSAWRGQRLPDARNQDVGFRPVLAWE